MDAADFVNDPGLERIIRQELATREASYEWDHDGLERLAEATGGLFFHDTGLDKALDRALVDQSGYYLLGYAAPSQAGARYHRVSVTVKRRGVHVRARSGYWSGR